MRKALAAVAVVALFGAALWRLTQTRQELQLGAPMQPENVSSPAASSTPANEAAPADARPQWNEHEARMDFHERVRTFFARAPAMSANEKAAQAGTLDNDIVRYHAAGELSAAEALSLRLALIRESAPQSEQKARMEELRDEYLARSAGAHAPSEPMFEVYKAREREIVAQVQAMHEIPDGLTRDEYLRRTLQREREALLGE